MEPPSKMKKYNTNRNYFQKKKQHFLEVGQRGFFATCNFREKDCVRECYNILNQYANELYGPEESVAAAGKNDEPKELEEIGDISDELQKEINAAATAKKASPKLTRFQAVTTGATNFLFIRTNLSDPVELVTRIMEDIEATRKPISRFLLRIVPVEIVCSANLEKIMEYSTKLIEKHFTKEGKTFSILFNKRYNNNIKKDDLITPLAEKISAVNSGNTVNLSNPEKSLVIEIVKGFCCLSVINGYMKYKRYNLVELANPSKNDEAETKDDQAKKEKQTEGNKEVVEADDDGNAEKETDVPTEEKPAVAVE